MDHITMYSVMAYKGNDWVPTEEKSLKTRRGAIKAAKRLAAIYETVKVVKEEIYESMEMSRVIWRAVA